MGNLNMQCSTKLFDHIVHFALSARVFWFVRPFLLLTLRWSRRSKLSHQHPPPSREAMLGWVRPPMVAPEASTLPLQGGRGGGNQYFSNGGAIQLVKWGSSPASCSPAEVADITNPAHNGWAWGSKPVYGSQPAFREQVTGSSLIRTIALTGKRKCPLQTPRPQRTHRATRRYSSVTL